jgi:hypothetical protein
MDCWMENVMKRFLVAAGAALTLMLTGCATTISSDVTTFHQWPAELQNKSYVLEAPPPQDDTLELRSYQNLVRAELARLGFQEAVDGSAPALKVAMRFTTTDIPVRVIEPMYPMTYYPSARFMFAQPYHRGYWGGRRYWGGGWYSPFYDPFWFGMPAYTEQVRHYYKRELQVGIKAANDGKRLFDVTVHNTSRELSTPVIMPALVHSAFAGFPGVSGVARRVELKREG